MRRTKAVDLRGPWHPQAERPPECRGCGRPLELARRGDGLAGRCTHRPCGERVVFAAVERRWVVRERARAVDRNPESRSGRNRPPRTAM